MFKRIDIIFFIISIPVGNCEITVTDWHIWKCYSSAHSTSYW